MPNCFLHISKFIFPKRLVKFLATLLVVLNRLNESHLVVSFVLQNDGGLQYVLLWHDKLDYL